MAEYRNFSTVGSKFRAGLLRSEAGEVVSLQLYKHKDTILFESNECQKLLLHLLKIDIGSQAGLKVRGYAREGEGAYLEVFDQFGSCLNSPLHLSEEDTKKRFLSVLIWQIT